MESSAAPPGCCRVLQVSFQAEYNLLNLNYNLILSHAALTGTKKKEVWNSDGALVRFPEKRYLNTEGRSGGECPQSQILSREERERWRQTLPSQLYSHAQIKLHSSSSPTSPFATMSWLCPLSLPPLILANLSSFPFVHPLSHSFSLLWHLQWNPASSSPRSLNCFSSQSVCLCSRWISSIYNPTNNLPFGFGSS